MPSPAKKEAFTVRTRIEGELHMPKVTGAKSLWIIGPLAVAGSILWTSAADAATLYVAKNGSDASNGCKTQATPCGTIAHGIAAMAGGDTLIIGDGTYAESIAHMPGGSPGAYTTIRAANDWGVTIDGSAFPDTFMNGITVGYNHYVEVRGFHVKMNQATPNNQPVIVVSSDHVKIRRCSASHAPTTGNAASFSIGPSSSYVLVEESHSYGGARYQFLVYQSDHVVVRQSVARSDYWNGSLQCAGFVNYDSVATGWQNNIVLDSDTAHCSGALYGGFFNENKSDYAPDTSQTLQGNIVLNVQAFFAGDLDWVVSGTRSIQDMVIWGSSGGYYANQGPGVTASVNAERMTVGGITGRYDGPNGGAAWGTGFSVYGAVQNTLTSSILTRNSSLGIADYTSSDYNAFFGNGANGGGAHTASMGPHDRTDDVVNASLRYLPRIEPGSPLKTAGKAGGQIGAEIMVKIGVSGTLHGEPGWNQATTEPLWPFPNEDQIRKGMASYSGPGAAGARGFATGNSLDGTPQTLTKYVWEYLGHRIPSEVYGPGGGVAPDAGTGGPGASDAGTGGPGASDAGAGSPGSNEAGAVPPGTSGGGANPDGTNPDGTIAAGNGGGCNVATRPDSGGATTLAGLFALFALVVVRLRRVPCRAR